MTIGVVVECARPECNNKFMKVTHNQKYCTRECTKIETNRRVMERYHERNAIRKGKKRFCKQCGQSLSRYNPNGTCNACENAIRKSTSGAISELMSGISWL